jgi:hypothetical protein
MRAPIALALGLSALLHLLLFQLFLVLGPEHATSPAPAPEIELISSQIPEHRALLESIQARSPAAALAHQLLPPEAAPAPRFRPSLPPNAPGLVQLQIPDLPTPELPPILPPLPPSPLPSESRPLIVLEPAALQNRILPANPPAAGSSPTQPHPTPREPFARFRITLSPSGTLLALELEKTSGNPAHDQQAESLLRSVNFAPDPAARNPLLGSACVLWPKETGDSR